jgi:hypothetical protein
MRLQLAIRFSGCQRASVSIITGLALPVLLGFASLVAEFGYGLLTKVENQRIADLAAYAAASAYASSGSTTAAAATAQNVALLNGRGATNVTVALIASPRSANTQALQVTITTKNIILLAPVLGFGSKLPVAANAAAELTTGSAACMLALNSGGTGVSLAGGAKISAPSCGVSSNTSLTVPCGTTITAKTITYNGTLPSQPCGGISGTISKAYIADPLVANAGVIAAANHVASVSSLVSPMAPSVTAGQDIEFGYNLLATIGQAAAVKCLAVWLINWTVTCPSGATYNFGTITVDGGLTVAFNPGGSSSTVYNFSGAIKNNGTALNFGPGIYNVAAGISNNGGGTLTFGAGTFNVGAGMTCNGAGVYSICNTGALMTFGGPSTFVLSAGLYNGGGSKITLGSGAINSFSIGKSSDGNALYLAGGATTTFADATLFQLAGNVTQAGGGCTILSAATQHDINGTLSTSGGLTLGSGTYSVTGPIAFGYNSGGDVSCGGTMIGVLGTSVTLVTAAVNPLYSGNCTNTVFCIGAGFSNVVLSAPTSGTYQNLVVLGPSLGGSPGGATISEGASGTTLSGAIHVPNGALSLSGSASIGTVNGQCLQIIAASISLSGGTSATASSCFAGSATASSAKLVQ